MRSKGIYIALFSLFATVGMAKAQDFFDDIYYNPKKDKSATTSVNSTSSTKKEKQSYYIADMGNMDVDTYNRRGEQYYVSKIDTIGNGIENGEDFIYTQEIQKYYNPTIVVDNANVLDDILSNAYGNVDIIIDTNGYPVFSPWYGYNWSYYNSYWSPWSWGLNIGPLGWSVGFYDPWYSWNWGWGPSWGWNPIWGPGWNPGPGPVWRPGPIAQWNPRGNRPSAPRPGWSQATQPRPSGSLRPASGNFRGPNSGLSTGHRPGSLHTSVRPSGVVNNGGKWEYNNSVTGNHRIPGGNIGSSNKPENNSAMSSGTNSKPGQGNSHRTPSTSNRNNNNVSNNNRTNNSGNRSVTTNRSNPGRSMSSGSRSTGGSSGSRGGGGRHR